MAFSIVTFTLTDFTLHFSLTFTKLLYNKFIPLLNNFTMQENVTETLYIDVSACKATVSCSHLQFFPDFVTFLDMFVSA